MSEAEGATGAVEVTPQKAGAGRIAGGLALALLSAVLLFIMWDYTLGWWPLVIVGFVPMYIAAYRVLPRKLAPLAFAIAAFGYWLAMFMQGGGVLPPAIVYGGTLLVAVLWGVISIWERKFTDRTNYKWFIVQLPLLWVALELLFQSNLIIGDMYWIALRAAPTPQIIQPVSIFSTPALSFIMIMLNAILALLIMKWMDKRWPQLADVAIPSVTVKWSAITTFGVTIVWVATSLVLYAQVSNQMGPTVKVAAVQTGIENTTSSGQLGEGGQQGTPADNARNAKLQAQLTEMTVNAAGQGAKFILWPEEELDYDVRVGNKAAWVGELAKRTNTYIASGFMPDSPELTSPNLVAVWYPNGEMSHQFYSKEHQVVAEGEAFVAGNVDAIYATSFGNLGMIICFDHEFPDSSPRTTVAAGANIVAVPAIDPYTLSHLRWQSLVFRAAENRVPFVKTDVGFDSAIVDANGVVLARSAVDTEDGEEALLVADVHIGPGGAPFTQMGSYPLQILVYLGLIARFIRQYYLWRRERKAVV